MAVGELPVSIIVSAYAVKPWIWQCLESVRTQKHQEFECIVVDDCSIDGTTNIIEEFAHKDRRFRHVRHDLNRGLYQARRTGLEQCSGDYVWQIDGDDYVDPEGLSHMIEIAKRENPDIVRGQFSINRDGKIFHPPWFPRWPDIRNTSLERCVHLARSPFGIWLNLVRKDFLDQLNPSNSPMVNLGEDIVFNASIFPETEKIRLTSKNVYFYRRGQQSYTTTSKEDRLYLDESIAHQFTFSNWNDLDSAPMIFSVNNSLNRVENTKELVKYLPKDFALKAIRNFQSVYKRWHPVDAYMSVNSFSRPDWSAESRPDVMNMLVAFHEREAEDIHCMILNKEF